MPRAMPSPRWQVRDLFPRKRRRCSPELHRLTQLCAAGWLPPRPRRLRDQVPGSGKGRGRGAEDRTGAQITTTTFIKDRCIKRKELDYAQAGLARPRRNRFPARTRSSRETRVSYQPAATTAARPLSLFLERAHSAFASRGKRSARPALSTGRRGPTRADSLAARGGFSGLTRESRDTLDRSPRGDRARGRVASRACRPIWLLTVDARPSSRRWLRAGRALASWTGGLYPSPVLWLPEKAG